MELQQVESKTALTVTAEIVVLCDERQKKLIEENPGNILVLKPVCAEIQSIKITDREIMPTMTPDIFKKVIKGR
jgi:hypothetical protein